MTIMILLCYLHSNNFINSFGHDACFIINSKVGYKFIVIKYFYYCTEFFGFAPLLLTIVKETQRVSTGSQRWDVIRGGRGGCDKGVRGVEVII